MVEILIFFVIASAIQGFLYTKQQKRVNEVFYTLREKGNVLVGMKKGWMKSGAIVLMLIKDDVIHEAYSVQGKTVFAKIKSLESIEGRRMYEVNGLKNKGLDGAFKDAYRRYAESLV